MRRDTGKPVEVRVCLIDEMGNWPTAAYVAWALGVHRPHLAVLAGIAGSLDSRAFSIGDVVVSDTAKMIYANKIKQFDPAIEVFVDDFDPNIDGLIQLHNHQTIFGDSFFRLKRKLYRPNAWRSAILNNLSLIPSYVNKLDLSPDEKYVLNEMKYAHLFCSNQVIDSETVRDFIVNSVSNDDLDYYKQRQKSGLAEARGEYDPGEWDPTPAPVVDMESAGFLNAVEIHMGDSTINPLIVRGISDVCADKNDDDQETAARNAILAALCLIDISVQEAL